MKSALPLAPYPSIAVFLLDGCLSSLLLPLLNPQQLCFPLHLWELPSGRPSLAPRADGPHSAPLPLKPDFLQHFTLWTLFFSSSVITRSCPRFCTPRLVFLWTFLSQAPIWSSVYPLILPSCPSHPRPALLLNP